jgi:hypothetical protein
MLGVRCSLSNYADGSKVAAFRSVPRRAAQMPAGRKLSRSNTSSAMNPLLSSSVPIKFPMPRPGPKKKTLPRSPAFRGAEEERSTRPAPQLLIFEFDEELDCAAERAD